MDDEKIEKNGWSYEHNPVDGHVLKHDCGGRSTTVWNMIYNGHITDAGWYLSCSDEYSDGSRRTGTFAKVSERFAKDMIGHWGNLLDWA